MSYVVFGEEEILANISSECHTEVKLSLTGVARSSGWTVSVHFATAASFSALPFFLFFDYACHILPPSPLFQLFLSFFSLIMQYACHILPPPPLFQLFLSITVR